MDKGATKAGLERRRDASVRVLAVGIVLLLVFGIGYGSSAWLATGGGTWFLAMFRDLRPAIPYLFVAIVALCLGSLASWVFWSLRLRLGHDPWAYDPELDGPDPANRRGLEDAREEPAPGSLPPRAR